MVGRFYTEFHRDVVVFLPLQVTDSDRAPETGMVVEGEPSAKKAKYNQDSQVYDTAGILAPGAIKTDMDVGYERTLSPNEDMSSAADAMLKLSNSSPPIKPLFVIDQGQFNQQQQQQQQQPFSTQRQEASPGGNNAVLVSGGGGGGGVAGEATRIIRKQREFIPEFKKDDSYWSKRRKNNESAKRSREKRRQNDAVMSQKIIDLTNENSNLKRELESIKRKFGLRLDQPFPIDEISSRTTFEDISDNSSDSHHKLNNAVENSQFSPVSSPLQRPPPPPPGSLLQPHHHHHHHPQQQHTVVPQVHSSAFPATPPSHMLGGGGGGGGGSAMSPTALHRVTPAPPPGPPRLVHMSELSPEQQRRLATNYNNTTTLPPMKLPQQQQQQQQQRQQQQYNLSPHGPIRSESGMLDMATPLPHPHHSQAAIAQQPQQHEEQQQHHHHHSLGQNPLYQNVAAPPPPAPPTYLAPGDAAHNAEYPQHHAGAEKLSMRPGSPGDDCSSSPGRLTIASSGSSSSNDNSGEEDGPEPLNLSATGTGVGDGDGVGGGVLQAPGSRETSPCGFGQFSGRRKGIPHKLRHKYGYELSGYFNCTSPPNGSQGPHATVHDSAQALHVTPVVIEPADQADGAEELSDSDPGLCSPLSQSSASGAVDRRTSDPKYVERRKRNNLAARKCRENRRVMNMMRAAQSSVLETENSKLKDELHHLAVEVNNLKQMIVKKNEARNKGEEFPLPPLDPDHSTQVPNGTEAAT